MSQPPLSRVLTSPHLRLQERAERRKSERIFLGRGGALMQSSDHGDVHTSTGLPD
jgi:hypothetical protein